jgi:hypothetical protein
LSKILKPIIRLGARFGEGGSSFIYVYLQYCGLPMPMGAGLTFIKFIASKLVFDELKALVNGSDFNWTFLSKVSK